jgi:hypothetical protein
MPYPDTLAAGRELTGAHRDLCVAIAGERYAAGETADGDAWADLAARIGRALERTFARFTPADVQRIQVVHLALLRQLACFNAGCDECEARKERSRALSSLGVLVLEASRGRLEQLRRGGAQ